MTALGIAALLVLPGAVLVRLLLGTSWVRCVALSPPVSVLLLSFTGALLGLAGIAATVLSVGGVVIVALAVASLCSRWTSWSSCVTRVDRTVRDAPYGPREPAAPRGKAFVPRYPTTNVASAGFPQGSAPPRRGRSSSRSVHSA